MAMTVNCKIIDASYNHHQKKGRGQTEQACNKLENIEGTKQMLRVATIQARKLQKEQIV